MAISESKKVAQVGAAFSLVLNDNGADLFKNSRYLMKKLIAESKYPIKFIAVGFHDKDRNEYGDLKTPHYHVVIEFEGKMRLSSCLNNIVDTLFCNENQISIEKCSDIGAQVRYILHLDDEDKYHYKGDIIYTNNFETCEFYLSHVRIMNEKHFLEILDLHPSKRELLRILGKKQYKDWRFAINDLLR